MEHWLIILWLEPTVETLHYPASSSLLLRGQRLGLVSFVSMLWVRAGHRKAEVQPPWQNWYCGRHGWGRREGLLMGKSKGSIAIHTYPVYFADTGYDSRRSLENTISPRKELFVDSYCHVLKKWGIPLDWSIISHAKIIFICVPLSAYPFLHPCFPLQTPHNVPLTFSDSCLAKPTLQDSGFLLLPLA